MSDWTRLRAPPGTDEANYGELRFRVHDDGTISVPPEAVDGLCKVGGFVVVDGAYSPQPEIKPATIDDARDLVDRLPDSAIKWRLSAILQPPQPEIGPRIKLRAGPGVGAASHGAEHFEPDQDGLIAVPVDAVPHFIAKAGYYPADALD